MYHHIGPLPPNADIFRKDLTVSPSLFEDELQHFAEQGIETVSLDDLMEHYAGGPELPKRSVILTFDDGYDDSYEYAFRLLQQYGMTGTFFVVTDFVGRPGRPDLGADRGDGRRRDVDGGAQRDPRRPQRGRPCGATPPSSTEPKRVLEEHLGHPVRFLAYPSGKYNAGTIAATRAAGDVSAVTVVHGTSHPALGALRGHTSACARRRYVGCPGRPNDARLLAPLALALVCHPERSEGSHRPPLSSRADSEPASEAEGSHAHHAGSPGDPSRCFAGLTMTSDRLATSTSRRTARTAPAPWPGPMCP